MEYKGYVIEPDGTYGQKFIKQLGGRGNIPSDLQGTWTTVEKAQLAIDAYVGNKKPDPRMTTPQSAVEV